MKFFGERYLVTTGEGVESRTLLHNTSICAPSTTELKTLNLPAIFSHFCGESQIADHEPLLQNVL